MGQYNLMFEQEEFTELVRLYSELAKIADRQMNEYQMILDIINTNAVISGESVSYTHLTLPTIA